MSGDRASALHLGDLGAEWDDSWDRMAGQALEAGFMQSSRWADFKRREGYDTLRVGLFEGDRLVGGASLMHAHAEGQPGFVLCPEGPVLPWSDTPAARSALRLISAEVQRRTKPEEIVGLRIEPHLAPPAPSLLRNWSRAPVDLTPLHTLMLDVTLSDDEVLAQMSPKGRYNTRLSMRHGVEVRRSSDLHDLAAFHGLFRDTAERQGFYWEPYGFFLNLGAALFPTGQAEVVLASWRGNLLSAIVAVYYGRRATYLYGASSPEHREVMPNHAAHWEIMREARRRGCVEYDLFAYDPFGLPDHLYAGISRFKMQLGGRRCDWMGARDLLFYDRLADRVVERMASEA